MKRLVIIIIVLFNLFPLLAEETIVTGTCPEAPGFVIRLKSAEELISGVTRTLATDTISEEGTFYLRTDIESTVYAIIDIEFQKGDIYLKPGNEYTLTIGYNPGEKRKLYFDRSFLEFELESTDSDSLNQRIRAINQKFNQFILNHFNDIYRFKKYSLVNTLRNELEGIARQSDDAYLQAYLEYKMAGLEQAAHMKSKDKIAREYLLGRPVLYNNVEYHYFFSQFFEKYLLTSKGVLNYHDVHDIFLKGGNFDSLMNLVRKDPYLSDERLSEYFLLKNLKDLYYDPEFDSAMVREMVTDLASTTKFPKHTLIAENLLHQFSRLKPGTKPPGLVLPDVDGNLFSLDSLKGKVVYLYFFVTGNPTCEYEQDRMLEMRESLTSQVVFLGVSADHNRSSFKSLVRSGKYPWTLLHYNHDIELLESYDAITYPLYMIIDKKGKIAAYPAPRPSEDPVNILLSLTRK